MLLQNWSLLPYILIIVFQLEFYAGSELQITKVVLRNLKKNDIGLLFDLTVANLPKPPKETLQFSIKSEKCCFTTASNESDCESSELICGEFEQVYPGENIKVTLVWPTLTLHNRVGYCDIELSAKKSSGEKINITRKLNFNTTLKKNAVPDFMADYFKDMTRKQNFTECETADLNPFRNCGAERCDEKYFGKRNHFNENNGFCEAVPLCNHNSMNMYYDSDKNECVDLRNFVTDDDIERIKNGDIDDVWYDNSMNENVMKRNVTASVQQNSMNESILDVLTDQIIIRYFTDYPDNKFNFLLFVVVTFIILYILFTCLIICCLSCSSNLCCCKSSDKHRQKRCGKYRDDSD